MVIAVDFGPRTVRAALVRNGVKLEDAIEVTLGQAHRLARFVAKHKLAHPDLALVSAVSEQCPAELRTQLEEEGGTIRWLPSVSWELPSPAAPDLVWISQWKKTPWERKRRVLRARLLAYLAHCPDEEATGSLATWTLLRWHYLMARELQDEILAYAQEWGMRIDVDRSEAEF